MGVAVAQSFPEMTFDLLESRHGIRQGRRGILFDESIPEARPSATLVETLRRSRHAVMVNERARACRLVAPVVSELEELRRGKVLALPECPLGAPGVEDLRGSPDFVLSGSLTPRPVPIVGIVATRVGDTDPALPPCVAALYASYLLNGGRPGTLHGCVTTGHEWQFVQFDGAKKRAHVDTQVYAIAETARLLGVLCHIVDAALAEMPELATEP
jgi:hypothetical protein